MKSERLTLTEVSLRWGASLASLWLCGIFAGLALASQTSDITIGWSTTFMFLYSAIMGGVTWAIYALDKRRAIAREDRISEATLHALTLLGGWSGAFLAQRWLRHKSQERMFQASAWAGMLLQLIAILAVAGWNG